MGAFRDVTVLQQRPLPPQAVPFREGDLRAVFIKGLLISLPWHVFMILATLIRFAQVSEQMPASGHLLFSWTGIGLVDLILSLLLFLGINLLLVLLHELIHAFAAPRHHEKQIWAYLDQGAMFVFFPEPLSKARFIWVSLAPNLLLAFIPWAILLIVAAAVPTYAFWWTFLVFFVLSLGGIGDYANIWHTLRQVPKGGQIHSYGIHSYWTPPPA